MGVGTNPTACFVVIASILTLVRLWLNRRREAIMNQRKECRKAQAKPRITFTRSVAVAFVETISAITTSFVAGFVTLSIYAKGAPQLS